MQTTYSPSRIGAFDDCKLKYKYHYIDRLESDLETIEAFRGQRVHEALDEFYRLVKAGSVKPLEWVLDRYEETWNKNFTDSIKIVKKDLTSQDYFNKGKEALTDYYNRYKPFDQAKIVSTERTVKFSVRHNNETHSFMGILDRLDWNDKTSMFEIHDYKVTNNLMTQEEADKDWQLGLYHVALKENWPDADRVKLVWHSLLFNKEMVSSRTEAELKELQAQVAEKVKEIESCADFSPKKSALCDWCDFQNICPLWKHPKKMEDASVNEYMNDPGVKLVARFAELEAQKNELQEEIYEIEKEQDKIKDAAVEFAEREKISIIDGPDARLRVEVKDELRPPTRSEDPTAWEMLRDALKREGKYEEVSTVNANMFTYRIRNNIWPQDFVDRIRRYLRQQVTKTVKLIRKY